MFVDITGAPQSLAEICRNMGHCCGFRALAPMENYPGFILFTVICLQTIEGSTTMFTAFLKKCIDRDVVAICRYIPRRNTPPKFVALLPQVSGGYGFEWKYPGDVILYHKTLVKMLILVKMADANFFHTCLPLSIPMPTYCIYHY